MGSPRKVVAADAPRSPTSGQSPSSSVAVRVTVSPSVARISPSSSVLVAVQNPIRARSTRSPSVAARVSVGRLRLGLASSAGGHLDVVGRVLGLRGRQELVGVVPPPADQRDEREDDDQRGRDDEEPAHQLLLPGTDDGGGPPTRNRGQTQLRNHHRWRSELSSTGSANHSGERYTSRAAAAARTDNEVIVPTGSARGSGRPTSVRVDRRPGCRARHRPWRPAGPRSSLRDRPAPVAVPRHRTRARRIPRCRASSAAARAGRARRTRRRRPRASTGTSGTV